MNRLRCVGVSKAFDGVQALAGLDLQLPESGIIAIIGPNGAGKTTLLNVLTGFIRPDAGDCWLNNHCISQLAPYKLVRMGMARTFQDLRLISQVSVLDNVMTARPGQRGEKLLGALLRIGVAVEESKNRDSALHILRFVGLEDQADELAIGLSYGQQKLLTLACCLATEAQILLLDEPVAGVHPKLTQQILDLLQRLRDQGKLIIFIEHDIAAVRKVADIVVVMDGGRVIAQGAPDYVLQMPEILEAYLA